MTEETSVPMLLQHSSYIHCTHTCYVGNMAWDLVKCQVLPTKQLAHLAMTISTFSSGGKGGVGRGWRKRQAPACFNRPVYRVHSNHSTLKHLERHSGTRDIFSTIHHSTGNPHSAVRTSLPKLPSLPVSTPLYRASHCFFQQPCLFYQELPCHLHIITTLLGLHGFRTHYTFRQPVLAQYSVAVKAYT